MIIILIIANLVIKQYLHLPHIRQRSLTSAISESKVAEPDDRDDNGDSDNAIDENVDDDNDSEENVVGNDFESV